MHVFRWCSPESALTLNTPSRTALRISASAMTQKWLSGASFKQDGFDHDGFPPKPPKKPPPCDTNISFMMPEAMLNAILKCQTDGSWSQISASKLLYQLIGIKTPQVHLKVWDTISRCAVRSVNSKLLQAAKKEFERLSTYFYAPSDSPIWSLLVIARKATSPFIRFCGDYTVAISKYMEIAHFPIPNAFWPLEKNSKFKKFLDLDLTNGSHQLPLDEDAIGYLSPSLPTWRRTTKTWLVTRNNDIYLQLLRRLDYRHIWKSPDDNKDAYHKFVVVVTLALERNLGFKMKKSGYGLQRWHSLVTSVHKENIIYLPSVVKRLLTCLYLHRARKWNVF